MSGNIRGGHTLETVMTASERQTVYLDHAATTPMLPAAIEAMTDHLARTGNASSLHGSGRCAGRTVEESRETIAAALGAQPSEVVFTSGGTEAEHLALKGLWWSRLAQDPRRRRILLSGIEHHAVLDPAIWLGQHEHAEIEWLPVDELGRVRPDDVRRAVESDPESVAFITLMMANNDGRSGRSSRSERSPSSPSSTAYLCTGCCQAIGQVPVDFGELGVDAMTVSAHKLGGPYGIGALIVHKETQLTPICTVGDRSATSAPARSTPPRPAGFAVAIGARDQAPADESLRLTELRDALIDGITSTVEGAQLSGDPAGRLPGNAHLSFSDCEGDSLLLLLDARGIEVSTGSACNAGVAEPSHVLLAMGYDDQRARGSLRFTLGHTSTRADVDAVLDNIGPVVERAKSAGLQNVGRNN